MCDTVAQVTYHLCFRMMIKISICTKGVANSQKSAYQPNPVKVLTRLRLHIFC